MIYVLILALCCLTLHAQDEPLPIIGNEEAVTKARILGLLIDKTVLEFNGNWMYGQHVSGGCYGHAEDYQTLLDTWAQLIDGQEPGTINLELVRVKKKMVEAMEALVDCFESVTDGLKKIRKATKSLPPK